MSDDSQTSGLSKRRRRANVPGGRSVRHEVWVSAEEEGELYRRALQQGVTIPRLLFESAVADSGETATARRDSLADLFRAHRELAAIGNNLNQLARFVNAEGGVPAEVQGELRQAIATVRNTALRLDEVIDELGIRS